MADIVEQIDRINAYVGAIDQRHYVANTLLIDASERCLERIIEAVIKLGEKRMAQIAPDTPFTQLRGLGNRLRHAYDSIEPQRIFEVIRNDLPRLRAAVAMALDA